MNPNFKTFQQFFNKCQKGSLEVMRSMKVEEGQAIIADLETWVIFKADLPDGYYDIRMNQAFLIAELNDLYPRIPTGENVAKAMISTETFLKYAPCVGDDEIRPVWNAICFAPDGIAATNAHMLRFEDWDTTRPIQGNFNALIPPNIAILAACKIGTINGLITAQTFGKKPKNANAAVEAQYVKLQFEDVTIIQRLIEGNFPQYRSVVPNYKNENERKPLKCYSIPLATLQDIVKTQKSFDAKGVWINDKEMNVRNLDNVRLTKSWASPQTCTMPDRVPDGIVMPLTVNDAPDTYAFNALFLARFTTGFKGNIIVGSYDNTRAFGVWLEPANALQAPKPVVEFVPQKQAETPVEVPVPEREAVEGEANPDLIIAEIHEIVKPYSVKWNNTSIRNIYLPRIAQKLNVVLSKVVEIYDQLSNISRDVTPEEPEEVETDFEEVEEMEVEEMETETDFEEVEEVPEPSPKPRYQKTEPQHIPNNSGHGRNVLPPKAEVTPIPEPVDCQIIHYSDRGIALIGNTKPIKDRLKELNGRWCPNLQINGEPVKAWVFSNKREQQIKQLLAS